MKLEDELRAELSGPLDHDGQPVALTTLCVEIVVCAVIRVLRRRQDAKGRQG